jgi:VCBS repeat-containing protein
LTVTAVTSVPLDDTSAVLSVCEITALTADTGEVARYQLSTNFGDAYLAVDADGDVRVWSDAGEDPFKALGVGENASIKFTYTVSDGHGGTDDANVTITVNGSNDAPTDIALTMTDIAIGNSLPSGSTSAPRTLGQLSAVDPDTGDTTFHYSLNSGSSTGFGVTDGGLLQLKTNLAENTTYTLDVRAADEHGAYLDETFNIIVGTKSAVDNPLGTSPTNLGDDVLYGANGNDVLFGDSGDDTLFGGGGNDTLYGGAGNDALYGAEQGDTFVFDTALDPATNVDTINEFTAGGSASNADHIALSNSIFGLGSSGTLAGAAFQSTTDGVATTATARIVYNSADGNLYYDADGSGATEAVLFAKLVGVSDGVVDAADFNLIA